MSNPTVYKLQVDDQGNGQFEVAGVVKRCLSYALLLKVGDGDWLKKVESIPCAPGMSQPAHVAESLQSCITAGTSSPSKYSVFPEQDVQSFN